MAVTPNNEGQVAPAPPDDGSVSGQPDTGQPLTVEEVEDRWKHRVSQKDKAHAAAEQALREENDALRRQLEGSRARSGGQSGNGAGGADGDTAYLREQLAQREREVEQERQLRQIEARRAKYPALARQIGDSGSGVFATTDDATLAKLNALADDETSGSTFAPTTPRKPVPVSPKPVTDMTKGELEAELRRSVERGDHRQLR